MKDTSKLPTQTNKPLTTQGLTTPIIYVLSHILIGFVGYHYPPLLCLFLFYQLYQYFLNKRFFLLPQQFYKSDIQVDGNTLHHTLNKLLQGVLGYCLASISSNIHF